ncbi:cytosine-5--methyltransferase [Exophiala viscosa]|uniref:cytosine-5--methyltransferase n=1 Tax=Exophiala viscosa TaxID=2486360 RepID=UPI002197BD86|nr:cytosine-5--methyltransferase [Exophiala viscosa]
MLQTATLLRYNPSRSRGRSRSPTRDSSNAFRDRPDQARPPSTFSPSPEQHRTRQKTFIDLTRPDEEGSQSRPYDLTIDDHVRRSDQTRDFELKDGTFMRVTSRETDEHQQKWIIGRRLINQNTPDLLMPESRTPKELVWTSFCDNSAREYERESRVPAADARRKCKIVFTNVPHAMLNINHVQNAPDNLFFCRWQRMTTTEDTVKGNQNMAGRTEHIHIADADVEIIELRHGMSQTARMAPAELRRGFRGRGNCDVGGRSSSGAYTYADFFCGAGGASQGAHDAGLALRLALDKDKDAIRTYSRNFARPGLDIQSADISNFITKYPAARGGFVVDIVHASPPCQPFSRANTTPNAANDAMNLATFTTVRDILEICKPRVVTLEEADGLTDGKNRDYLRLLLSCFIEFGYSVQWRVVEMERYGVPQSRKRFVLIASGPGEKLSPFPAPTHGLQPGLHPPPTIRQAIRKIPYHPRLHNIAATRLFDPPKSQLSWDKVTGTITCNGGAAKVYHPRGRRKYTMRELLALQTFPASFDFPRENPPTKTLMRRQIGNAVPPAFSRVLFETVRDALKENDVKE